MRKFTTRRDESGVAMVEAALVLPVVLILILCAFEFGLLFRNLQTLHSASRAGARIGSSLGTDDSADQRLVQQVMATSGGLPANSVKKIIVFEANANGGFTDPSCEVASVFGKCSVYDIFDINDRGTDANWGCTTAASHDIAWCPHQRQNNQAIGVTHLGVKVEMAHHYLTSFMPFAPTTLQSKTVMMVEPLDE
jgi:Flp pilus assembly pilin Flp